MEWPVKASRPGRRELDLYQKASIIFVLSPAPAVSNVNLAIFKFISKIHQCFFEIASSPRDLAAFKFAPLDIFTFEDGHGQKVDIYQVP
jgi:hypothetical protein